LCVDNLSLPIKVNRFCWFKKQPHLQTRNNSD